MDKQERRSPRGTKGNNVLKCDKCKKKISTIECYWASNNGKRYHDKCLDELDNTKTGNG